MVPNAIRKLVKCPKCNEEILTKGSIFFRHCGMAFVVDRCLMKEIDGLRYQKNTDKLIKPTDNNKVEQINLNDE